MASRKHFARPAASADDHPRQPAGRTRLVEDRRASDTYQTMSIAADPGSSTFAFWVAQQLLAGNKLPHDMSLPTLTVTSASVDKVLAYTAPGTVASNVFTRDQVVKLVECKRRSKT